MRNIVFCCCLTMACLQCRNINVLVVLRRFCSIFLGDRLMRMVFGKDLEGHQCWCCFLRLWFNYSWFVVILLLLMCPWAWLSWPEVLPAVLIHRSANLICSSFFNLLPWRPDFNPHTSYLNYFHFFTVSFNLQILARSETIIIANANFKFQIYALIF